MMYDDFLKSLMAGEPPSESSELLQALWYDKKGLWNRAHEIVQTLSSLDSAWIHAYLHRKEGDLANANYWYTRAGRVQSSKELTEEWEEIVRKLL